MSQVRVNAGAPYAERVVVTETPSWSRDCRSSRDMEVYASESTKRIAERFRVSIEKGKRAMQLNSRAGCTRLGRSRKSVAAERCRQTCKKVALAGPIASNDNIVSRGKGLDLSLVAVWKGISQGQH